MYVSFAYDAEGRWVPHGPFSYCLEEYDERIKNRRGLIVAGELTGRKSHDTFWGNGLHNTLIHHGREINTRIAPMSLENRVYGVQHNLAKFRP